VRLTEFLAKDEFVARGINTVRIESRELGDMAQESGEVNPVVLKRDTCVERHRDGTEHCCGNFFHGGERTRSAHANHEKELDSTANRLVFEFEKRTLDLVGFG